MTELQPWEQTFDIELFEKEYFEFLENDPEHIAIEWEFHDWKHFHGENARSAYFELMSAKQKIKELMEEVNKQESIIRASKKTIQNHKIHVQTCKRLHLEQTGKRGRPERSEYKERIVAKFMMKWVASLKDALEVKSCGAKGGLANLVCSTVERNWRRWLNGDAIPSHATFENLLDSKIAGGKYAGKLLSDVPVTPTHNQILALLQFI